MVDIKNIIAGSCSFESFEEAEKEIQCLLQNGCNKLRAMLWKPRTAPESFQGIGSDGLNIIYYLNKQYPQITFVTEVMDLNQFLTIKLFSEKNNINFIYQIGARNSQNYSLLKVFSERSFGPINILYKRGISQTIQEYLDGSRYLDPSKNNIIMCLRGIRGFETETRFTSDIDAICVLKDRFEFTKDTNYQVFFDPSHSCGDRKYVPSLSLSAIIAGADGLEIEIHSSPDNSKVDAKQTISFESFNKLIHNIKKLNGFLYE